MTMPRNKVGSVPNHNGHLCDYGVPRRIVDYLAAWERCLLRGGKGVEMGLGEYETNPMYSRIVSTPNIIGTTNDCYIVYGKESVINCDEHRSCGKRRV
jgi:hypothetical protein